MFICQPEPGRHSRRGLGHVLSWGLHLGLLGILLYRPMAPRLQPMSSLRGEGGRAGVQMLYLPGISASASATVADPHQERRLALRKPAKRRPPAATPEPAAVAPGAATPGLPGDLLGALYSGVATGHDVHIALPVFAPDPPIVRTKLPDWVRGDVVVEVTIDQTGTVVATRVLQTVGFGLEEIVVATLRQWRFTPAKIDGVSVASRQDIHFHFPS